MSNFFRPEEVEAIGKRRAFTGTWSIGYLTHGGSYVIASSPNSTDSGLARDLALILPAELGHGRVLQLYVGTNPGLLPELEAILAKAGA